MKHIFLIKILSINLMSILISMLISISASNSYPLISTFTSYERLINETIKQFSSAVDKIDIKKIDLSKYEFTIDIKDINNSTKNGKLILQDFKAVNPLLQEEDFYGQIINNSTIFLDTLDTDDTFQIDLNLNFLIIGDEKEIDLKTQKTGSGFLRFFVKNFNFTLGYGNNESIKEYIIEPDLEISFMSSNFTIVYYNINNTNELKNVENLLNEELRKNKNIEGMEIIIAEYIEKNIENFFKKSTEKFSYLLELLENKPEPVAIRINPILKPEVGSFNNNNKGLINYLDGKIYNSDGSEFSFINYDENETSINQYKNIFDLSLYSNKQIFISYKVFADLMLVDFMKQSVITIYEGDSDKGKDNLFKFNLYYLNKFMPGLNYKYTNSQKFYIEIKLKDIKYYYGKENNFNDNNNNNFTIDNDKSFVIVETDIFFKTAETNSGINILDLTVETKAFFDIYEVDYNNYNVKFADNIEILKLTPKSYASISFYDDLFKEEFQKSFTITNIGLFDYNLFRNPFSINNLYLKNCKIKQMAKGILFYENQENSKNLNEEKKNGIINKNLKLNEQENNERKNLKFLR